MQNLKYKHISIVAQTGRDKLWYPTVFEEKNINIINPLGFDTPDRIIAKHV